MSSSMHSFDASTGACQIRIGPGASHAEVLRASTRPFARVGTRWKASEGIGRHRKASKGIGRHWKALEGIGRHWEALERVGRRDVTIEPRTSASSDWAMTPSVFRSKSFSKALWPLPRPGERPEARLNAQRVARFSAQTGPSNSSVRLPSRKFSRGELVPADVAELTIT